MLFATFVFNRSRSKIMRTSLRLAVVVLALPLSAMLLTPPLQAATASHPPASSAEALLFDAANRERAAAGLPPFAWDENLAIAARLHADRMVQHNTLSHQFAGEAPLQDRARQAGARFSLIAENVAEGPTPQGLHTQWMNSAPHRANLLDHALNSIGIAVIRSGNLYFAVQDFSVGVPHISLERQEVEIYSQLEPLGLHAVDARGDARKTCAMDRGFAGQRPGFVLRYETSDLGNLPDEIEQTVRSRKLHSVAVGACEPEGSSSFTRFRIAILLY
jgi:uncharacterized protein YkwD